MCAIFSLSLIRMEGNGFLLETRVNWIHWNNFLSHFVGNYYLKGSRMIKSYQERIEVFEFFSSKVIVGKIENALGVVSLPLTISSNDIPRSIYYLFRP